MSWARLSRTLGISKSTLIAWSTDPAAHARRRAACPRCGTAPLPSPAYAALLGYYLGDGHIARTQGYCYYALRITCDNTYPGIIADVSACITAVRPTGRIALPKKIGCVNVQSQWQHWPCLFPQHGPGRKHERPIVLAAWQREIVENHQGPLLRGLFHSDGCRVNNWTRRTVAGEPKVYRYPRWQFANASADIRELCCWALDLVEIPWRQSNTRVISVSRRDAVARLDTLIGPKT
jgi:hypothetical protein